MAMHIRRNIAALSWPAPALAVALAGASASGQTAPLDVVDQQVEDVSPLAVSLRESQTSLRQPADFGRVYRFQDDSNRLARAQGGLYAVFPRSVYVADKKGNVYPIVPPDTVYYIGPPPGFAATTALRAVAGRDGAVADRIDGRIETRVAPGIMVVEFPRQPPTKPRRYRSATLDVSSTVTPSTGIVGDPEYRARRLRSLMQDAAGAWRSFRPREDRRPRRRSTPGTPANGPGTPSGG